MPRLIYTLFTIIMICLLTCGNALAADNIVNVYIFSDEIPPQVIQQFEKDTGIKVNISSYDSNETMYAKLLATGGGHYDVIMPSSYYVDKMRRQSMLEKIDKTQVPNAENLDPFLLNHPFDPSNSYNIPYVWGVTGIFINKKYLDANKYHSWRTFWQPQLANQLLLLNDPREVFSIALICLGYSPNDSKLEHITKAYHLLQKLMPNVKLFATDTATSIVADGDARIGMLWNGDVFRTMHENKNIDFIFPKDGFIIWIDCLAIPQNAPHYDNALKFINYVIRADKAKFAAMDTAYGTSVLTAKKLLPAKMRNSRIIYPPKSILDQGIFQTDITPQALALIAKYWQMLKLGG